MTRRVCAVLLLLLGLAALAAGCGRTQSGGDQGSETHWLRACETSSDCTLGDCLCGVCTLPCSSVRECPAPLDQCLAQAPGGGECGERICQLQSAEQSPQALAPEPVPELDKLERCDGGRLVDFVQADAVFPDPAGYLTRVVTDGDHGFLLFGENLDGFVSLSTAGDFVRQLPLPDFEQRAVLDHAVALADGSLLLGGTVGDSQLEHGWIGKLDANWNPLWEQPLELESVEQTDLVALPDGGAVLAGVRWLDRLDGTEGSEDDVFMARFSAEGELLWERRASFNGAHSFSDQDGFRLLALSAERLHLVVPADDGIFLMISDLDGNVDEASLQQSLPESLRSFSTTGMAETIGIEALDEGRVAVFSLHDVLVLDAASQPQLEYSVGDDEYIAAVRFDPARAELVIAGHYIDTDRYALPGPWIRALGLDGEVRWEAWRPALDLDGQGNLEASADSAPPLTNAAIDGKGNMIMTGQIGRGLEWVWVGAEACGG
jgi:hypothetical protein